MSHMLLISALSVFLSGNFFLLDFPINFFLTPSLIVFITTQMENWNEHREYLLLLLHEKKKSKKYSQVWSESSKKDFISVAFCYTRVS